MKFIQSVLFSCLLMSVLTSFSQSTRDDINGEWSDQQVTLYNTPEAAVMVRVGDIDNLGFGWPTNYDPFSGASTPAHSFPFSPETEDVDGTDRIMVITSYVGSPPNGQDGYTNTTTRPENLPRPIVMNYNLNGTIITSAVLQIFVDDFQASRWGANYFVTMNQFQLPGLAQQVNSLLQTGPIGKLITFAIPASHLSYINSGSLELLFDDLTTGAGDGYAIDFVKLLINPTSFTYTGTITGTVTDLGNGQPIQGALVSASGIVQATTDNQGNYTLSNVPAGLINVTASATGFKTHSGFVDLQDGQTVTYYVQMEVALTPECDTLHYPLPGTPTLFFVNDNGGYVCGNNSYGDLAKADYFDVQQAGKQLHKGLFEFAYVTKGSGQDPDVEFRVWDDQGTGGKPGNVIGIATAPLSQIFDDVNAGEATEVLFDPPVSISGPFYLGVMLPSTAGDTIALVSTDDGEVNPGTAWEMWSDLSWYPFSDASSWQLLLSQAIYAVYCDQGFGIGDLTEIPWISIYPNPAREQLHIESELREPVTVNMTNFMGQKTGAWSFDDASHILLPVHHLSPGMYLVTIMGKDFKVSRKVMVN